MDFTDFSANQLVAAGGAASFVLACLLVRLLSGSAKNRVNTEDPRNHLIRELEADLRLVRRQYAECQEDLAAKGAEFTTAVETLQGVRSSIAELETEAEDLRQENSSSVAKIRELRLELQDRATQTIREHMRAEEAETELQVARAGSDAVMSEITRLEEERQHLSDTMRVMEDQVSQESTSLLSEASIQK